jgi:S-adenosylmethionine synthetase
MSERSFEIVERKGLGHPDSICDAVMEEAARAVERAHVETFGSPKHFNLDKCLLAAGRSEPGFGGGTIREPMRFVFGDRALYEHQGRRVPIEEILVESARRWFRSSLRFVDLDRHVVFQNEVRATSPQLRGLFATKNPSANDTSAAYGFAPLSPTERLVLETERFLNGAALKAEFPEVGEDIKVMAVRRGRALALTVAIAFVDRFIDSEKIYFERKDRVRAALERHLAPALGELSELTLSINTLDAPGGGADSVYLTVTGTSAEGADSGQVGRGNRLSGVFSALRPSSNEAIAGKNPHSHVGKIYNHLAQHIAGRIAELEGVREAGVHLVSQIGRPLSEPHLAAVELALEQGVGVDDVQSRGVEIVEAALREPTRF